LAKGQKGRILMDFSINDVLKGNKGAVARVLNLLEERGPSCHERNKSLIDELTDKARPDRHVIGVTGPPGAGKSSLLARLVSEYRARQKTVSIIAVDPSSKRSGGALLGDRARISGDPSDEGTFIRSMASGSHSGGLAWATRQCLTVFEAVYDVVVLETVGVGQSDIEVDHVADTVVFIAQPGSGDALQYMKAGVMEIPHVVVVNKADQKALSTKTYNDLMVARSYSPKALDGWMLEVVKTSALEGWGHDELVDILLAHRKFLSDKQIIHKLRLRNRIEWALMLFKERFGSFGLDSLNGETQVRRQIEQSGLRNPFAALDMLTENVMQVNGFDRN